MNLGMSIAIRRELSSKETYSTASMPSRKTVTNGRRNIAYFSDHCFTCPFPNPMLSFCSRTFAIFTRHLSCSLLTRRSAAPMSVMMMAATSEKAPS